MTQVCIDPVNTASSVLTGVAVALLDLDITDRACVSRVALTCEGGNAILTHTVVARCWYTVIDVLLTKRTSEACGEYALLLRPIEGVMISYCLLCLIGYKLSFYPPVPSAHSQSYPLGRSMHLAPFKQGVLEHSSMSIWHISPLKPENSKHIYIFNKTCAYAKVNASLL